VAQSQYTAELCGQPECDCCRYADKRLAELEEALRRVVRDVNDYEEANQLSPNPGRTECWDSVAHAKAVLAGS
jgi:predicted ATPase